MLPIFPVFVYSLVLEPAVSSPSVPEYELLPEFPCVPVLAVVKLPLWTVAIDPVSVLLLVPELVLEPTESEELKP